MEIARITEISYNEFVENYLSKNMPCLLDERFTRNWNSRQEWICNGKPCFDLLRKIFGEATVPVADCNKVQFQSHPKHSMLFKDFIGYWKEINNGTLEGIKRWYLKDWHFCKQFPDYKAYVTPTLFQSDWLNEFWDHWTDMNDDYRFVYMGPQGTWTPFHADVFRSYSWSANICGHKKWILYPPGSEKYLKDNHGNLVFDVTSPQIQDRQKFPHFHKAPEPIVINQKEGEIIFVPSCWYHQVINMEDTISINHNWINGSGVLQSWQHLNGELQLVKRCIEDCKEMEGWDKQCQIILEANSGINFLIFFKFLCWISYARLHFLKIQFAENANFQEQYQQLALIMENNSLSNEADTSNISKARECMYHSPELCLFDLNKTREVLEQFVDNDDVEEKLKTESLCLLNCLTRVISEI